MSTNNDGWILMSERKPTEADLPILLWNQCVPKAKYCATGDALRSQLGLTCFSAWMKAPPPPRERTQREKDRVAWEKWRQQYATVDSVSTWLDALAYERAEVGKMLPGGSYGLGEAQSALAAIRARCGGGK